MANLPAELKSLPLEHIIGSPLQAAIKAQALAARTTVDFIQSVGLQKNQAGELVAQIVDFKFDRTLEETQPPLVPGGPAVKNFRIVPSKLEVPLLSIVPIPFIRITDMSIDFEYKIHDIETSSHEDELNVQMKAKASYWFVSAEVSGSYTNKNANKRETDRSTSLRINVNAAQDNIPEGLARVLDMMHDQLKVVPLNTGSLLPQPTAKVDQLSPLTASLAAQGGKTTFTVTGSGLKGAMNAKVNDQTIQVANLVATQGKEDTEFKVDVTLANGTPQGEKTLSFDAPQGSASVRFAVIA